MTQIGVIYLLDTKEYIFYVGPVPTVDNLEHGVILEKKRFLDVQRLPKKYRDLIREMVIDVIGFTPWEANHYTHDWCWTSQDGEVQYRVPLHTHAGYQIGCALYATVLKVIDFEVQTPCPGDTFTIVEDGECYYLDAIVDGEKYHYLLPLKPGVRSETDAELLLSALKIELAKSRDERHGPNSRRVRKS